MSKSAAVSHGMRLARERGAQLGRPREGPTMEAVIAAYEEHGSYGRAAKALRCSKSMVYRRLLESKGRVKISLQEESVG